MKTSRFLPLVALLAAIPASAQQTPPPSAPPATPAVVQSTAAEPPAATPQNAPTRTAEELQKLVAPIALYPDALIAVVLPACTVPTEIVLAARYLAAGKDPNQIDEQPWDDSVKALARYPDVIKFLDTNLDLTMELGNAVMAQQADVLKAVQTMRARAQAQGNLKSTPQQNVITEDSFIVIESAQPDVVYVPQYDPGLIYSTNYETVGAPLLTYDAGFPDGAWLNSSCNWGYDYIGVWGLGYRRGYGWGPRRPPGWRPPPPGFRPPGYPAGGYHRWRPPANRPFPGRPNRPGVSPAGIVNRPGTSDRAGNSSRPNASGAFRPNINAPNRPITRPANSSLRPGFNGGGTFRPGLSGAQTRQYSNRGQLSRQMSVARPQPRMNRPMASPRPAMSRPAGGGRPSAPAGGGPRR